MTSFQSTNDELEIAIDQANLRLKLCLINQTDICSKSLAIPTGVELSSDSSEIILILIGKFKNKKEIFNDFKISFIQGAILGLCVVAGLIGLVLCVQQRRRKSKSKTSSTDTLKAHPNGNHFDHFHATPVRVVDTNSCLYFPTQTGTVNEGRLTFNLYFFSYVFLV